MSEDNVKSKDDKLLRILVGLANSELMDISITLIVKGIVIVGYVIGYKRYYDGVIKVLSKAKVIDTSDQTSSQAGDKLVELFENFKDMAIEETPDGPTFIHLEKAIVVNDSSGNLPGQTINFGFRDFVFIQDIIDANTHLLFGACFCFPSYNLNFIINYG
jgi:hypothetical protein